MSEATVAVVISVLAVGVSAVLACLIVTVQGIGERLSKLERRLADLAAAWILSDRTPLPPIEEER